MAVKSLDEHIERTPEIDGGQPRISGQGVRVLIIAHGHERLGKTAEELAAEYNLTRADVYAALAYYFDHQDEFDLSDVALPPSRSSLALEFWRGVGSVLEFFPSPRRFDKWRITQDIPLDASERAFRDRVLGETTEPETNSPK